MGGAKKSFWTARRWVTLPALAAALVACSSASPSGAPPTTSTASGGAAAASVLPSPSGALSPPPASASPAASPSAAAPAQLTSINVVTTAVSGAYAGIWTAADAGYFQDEGLDVQLSQVTDTSRALPTLTSHEAQLSTFDGQVLVEANLNGANLRAIASVTNRFVFSIMTDSSITSPQDLKGKKLGISGFGSSNDTAARQALAMWGLVPQQDVTFVPLSTMPGVLAGLEAHQVESGIVSPPTNTQAKQAGFNELINLAKDGPPWPSVTVAATEDYLQQNPQVVLGFVRGYSRGIARFRTDEAFGVSVIKKHLQLSDQSVAEDTWQQFSQNFDLPPYVTAAGLQSAINTVAQDHPEVKNTTPDQYVDNSFVQQLESSGFYTSLP